MIWDTTYSVIPGIFIIFLVLPLAPAVVVGRFFGARVKDISTGAGTFLGVLCGLAVLVLQPFALVWIDHDFGGLPGPTFCAAIIVVSAALSGVVCCLWVLTIGWRLHP